MVKMQSPYGTVVMLSEEKAERMERMGYRRILPTPEKKRGRPRKVQTEEE